VTELFRFEHVGLSDGGTAVLDDVDVAVQADGITVVSGPSGSGKSTFLRMCNRLVAPTTGRILLRGRPLDELDPVALRRQVGMVFQRPTVFDGTCLDNLRAACVRHEPLAPAAAESALARVGLDPELLGRDAKVLSGGEAQRLCLARTLTTGCEVLLADEPTSALDHEATAVLEELARELADGGMPVLWVTHDRGQADRLADHRLTVEEGRVHG
jgi:putative ABC transport system ATP-binding protein